ncbi:MAG: hypothetical protein U0791_20945 [Gemmataceae bacterium]
MTVDPAAPRILLFGHPGSGKSSLLGALHRAGEQFGPEVIDPSGRLPRISHHLYARTPLERTQTELVTYELRLKHGANRPVKTVVIHDCDGNAANALLKHPDPITERAVRGLVASAVVQADLLALVVNAGAADEDLDDAFDEFLMLLERVHGRKVFEREVGGFPIELILTQCDALFERGDTRERWLEEVASRLTHALNRFEEFLREQGAITDYLPFGSITLHGHAVAVREPGGNEPFGVAECFRELFHRAEEHRNRVKRSQKQLRRTLWAVACLVWLLFAGAVAVSLYQPPPADPGLASRVQSYRDRELPAAERLSSRNLAKNRRLLSEFQSDPGFFALPADLREFVAGRLSEVDEYQAYAAKLAATPSPAETRSLEELARTEAKLLGELASPARYTWSDTEAGRLRDKWLADAPALRGAEAAWQEWYRGLVNQALALTHTRSFEGEWRDRVAALEAAGTRPPFDDAAPIPGSPVVPLARGEAATYGAAAAFDRVYEASRDWEFTRTRLGRMRDFADALGLTADTSRKLLEIPLPGVALDPAERLEQIDSDTTLSLKDLNLANFPEPGRAVLAARLRESTGHAAKRTRALIGAKLGGDTPEAWRKLADELADPAIRDWSRLFHLLLRLEDSLAPDPLQELAAFLRGSEFAFDIKGFELTIPAALRVPSLVPAGPLAITVIPANGEPVVRNFKLTGEAVTEGLNTQYRFVPEKPGVIAFKPGDGLRIELPVRSGEQKLQLVWDDSTNRTYPFDRFSREPKLSPGSEPGTDVVLAPAFGSRVPKLPLLLPDAKR